MSDTQGFPPHAPPELHEGEGQVKDHVQEPVVEVPETKQGDDQSQVVKSARKEPLQRHSSKSRLSKQDEVEEEDHSPSSETSDATIIAAGVDTPVVRTPGGSPESSSPDDNSKLESQRSVDSDKSSPTQGNNPKAKLLVRSKAVCDDTSPPPEDGANNSNVSTTTLSATNSASVSPVPATMATLTVSPTPHRRQRLEKDSSQGSVSDNSNSPMLSRDSSMEYYTDSTGTDLESFIKMTLNKNRNDRMTLMELEAKMSKFIKDSKQQYYKFHQMSSYHRMLVHRVAAFFGLDHNVDQSGKCVVVNRTGNTRIPDFRFSDHISDEMTDDPQQPKKLLKRDDRLLGGSLDETGSSGKMLSKKSRSLEERKHNYEIVKTRIFNAENSQDGSIPEGAAISGSQSSMNKSSLTSSKEEPHWSRWSSADSSGYSTDNSLKTLKITKASSFPSYVLSRSDSRNMGNTRLTTADSQSSGTSGLSSPMTRPATIPSSPPSEQLSESSGSNQSAASPAQIHNQSGDGHSPGPFPPVIYDDNMTIWVATTTGVIPTGSIIINKQTCQPYMLPDGTPYRWNVPPSSTSQMISQQQFPMSSIQPTNPADCYPVYTSQGNQPLSYQTQESGGNAELIQRVSMLTISPQQSTESLPPEPPGGMAGQPMYGNILPGSMAQPTHPQGYGHVANPQGQYFMPNTSTCNPQIRILYQPTMPYQRPPSQGQIEMQGQGHNQAGQGQQAATNGQFVGGSYQSPFSQLTVHSVEFQQQGNVSYNCHAPHLVGTNPGNGGYSGDPQHQQTEVNYGGFVSSQTGLEGAVSHAPYLAIQGYPSSSNSQLLAFQGQVQGHYVTSQASGVTFRPKSPPVQPMVPAVTPGSSIGQPVGNIGVNPGAPQYISYTYPGQQQPPPGGATHIGSHISGHPPGAHPGVSIAGVVQQCVTPAVVGPRHQTAPVWTPVAQGTGTPTQGYHLMRPPTLQLGDNRFIGQPLQQVARPHLQPLFTRARVPSAANIVGQSSSAHNKVNKGRKSWPKGGATVSPQSSVESTESSEELSGGYAMEVHGLPPQLSREDFSTFFDDLIKQGTTFKVLEDEESLSDDKPLSELTILAVFPNEHVANRIASYQKPYKLRPYFHQNFDSPDLAAI